MIRLKRKAEILEYNHPILNLCVLSFEIFFTIWNSIIVGLYIYQETFYASIMWYSYWAVYKSIFDFFIYSIGSSLRLYLYFKKKNPYEDEWITTIINIIDGYKSLNIIIIIIMYCQTNVAFWISYNFQISGHSFSTFVSHFINLPLILVYSIFIPIFNSWWALIYSELLSFIYYMYMLFTLYYIDDYVYIALNPNNAWYWWIIIVGMPFAQFFGYLILRWIVNQKNKILAQIEKTYLYENMKQVKWNFCITRELHWKMEMTTSLLSLYGLIILYCSILIGIFICVGYETILEYYRGILCICVVIFVYETFLFFYTWLHIFNYKGPNNRWIIMNCLSFIPHLIQIIITIDGLIIYPGERIAWTFFVSLAFSLVICSIRIILLYVDLTHRGKPFDEICYDKYFPTEH